MEVPFSSKVCTQEAPGSVSSVAETNQTNKPTRRYALQLSPLVAWKGAAWRRATSVREGSVLECDQVGVLLTYFPMGTTMLPISLSLSFPPW